MPKKKKGLEREILSQFFKKPGKWRRRSDVQWRRYGTRPCFDSGFPLVTAIAKQGNVQHREVTSRNQYLYHVLADMIMKILVYSLSNNDNYAECLQLNVPLETLKRPNKWACCMDIAYFLYLLKWIQCKNRVGKATHRKVVGIIKKILVQSEKTLALRSWAMFWDKDSKKTGIGKKGQKRIYDPQ